jgi:hypothetical protein
MHSAGCFVSISIAFTPWPTKRPGALGMRPLSPHRHMGLLKTTDPLMTDFAYQRLI